MARFMRREGQRNSASICPKLPRVNAFPILRNVTIVFQADKYMAFRKPVCYDEAHETGMETVGMADAGAACLVAGRVYRLCRDAKGVFC